MLGHLEDISFLAGVNLASIIFNFLYWTINFLRMGSTGLTARLVGADEREEVFQVLYRFGIVSLCIGGGILIFQGVIETLGFALLSGEKTVMDAGQAYYRARIWGGAAAVGNMVLIGWYLGRGKSSTVLIMTILANVTNVILNYVFIIRMGLSAEGAGLASMAAQYIMLLGGLLIFFREKGRVNPRLVRILDREAFNRLFRFNTDILIRTICLMGCFSLFTNFSSVFGTLTLATNSILMLLFMTSAFLVDGAAFAVESLSGQMAGRGDFTALRQLLKTSIKSGLIFAGLFLALVFTAPGPIFSLLTSHQNIIDSCIQYSYWLIPVLGFGSIAFIFDGFLLGLTRGRDLRDTMLLSMLLFFLPPALFAYFQRENHLLWFALAVFMLARSVFLGLRIRKIQTPADAD